MVSSAGPSFCISSSSSTSSAASPCGGISQQTYKIVSYLSLTYNQHFLHQRGPKDIQPCSLKSSRGQKISSIRSNQIIGLVTCDYNYGEQSPCYRETWTTSPDLILLTDWKMTQTAHKDKCVRCDEPFAVQHFLHDESFNRVFQVKSSFKCEHMRVFCDNQLSKTNVYYTVLVYCRRVVFLYQSVQVNRNFITLIFLSNLCPSPPPYRLRYILYYYGRRLGMPGSLQQNQRPGYQSYHLYDHYYKTALFVTNEYKTAFVYLDE